MSLMYCFGAICGDGATYIEQSPSPTYVLWFSSHDRPFADKLYTTWKEEGYNPYLYPRFEKHTFRWIVKVKNKELYGKYQQFRNNLNLSSLAEKEVLDFIRGFFDAEGYITENVAGIVNTDKAILEQLQTFLRNHGVNGNILRGQRAGDPVCVHGVKGVRRKDMWVLNIYRDRKDFSKLLCMEA